jgi:toxin ParE1/3/4
MAMIFLMRYKTVNMTTKKVQFQLSVAAKSDLIRIRRYTRKNWGEQQATRYLNEIKQTILRLSINPSIGKERFDVDESVFSFPHKSHVIYYFKHSERIIILGVLHKRMLPKRHLSIAVNT